MVFSMRSNYSEIVYFITSTERDLFRYVLKFTGEAKPSMWKCVMYEAKPSEGIIEASAGKSLSAQVMNGTFHYDA
jgi:hypothetical protein